MVTSKPLTSVFSFWPTLLSASAIGMSLPGTYLITKLYGCVLRNNLYNIGGALPEDMLQMHVLKRLVVTLAYELSTVRK